jgi:hypothetical protein
MIIELIFLKFVCQVNSYSINRSNFNFNSLLFLFTCLLNRRKANYKIDISKDTNIETGARASVVVKALCCKPEGRGFKSR